MKKFKKIRFNFYIREPLKEKLEAYCSKKGMPMSLFIDMAIEEKLKREKTD